MSTDFRALLVDPKIRYVVVGGSVYVLELCIIFIAQGLGPVGAVGLSYSIGTIVSFALQKFVTFGDHRTQRRIVGAQLLATCGLVLFNFCFTLLVTALLAGLWSPWMSRTLALAITTIWNFYLYKTRIFTRTVPVII